MEINSMAFNLTETDRKLALLYAEKKTCNVESISSVDPEDVWYGMNYVAMYNKTLNQIKQK